MTAVEQSAERLVLEGSHIPGWVPAAYFGGIFAALVVTSLFGPMGGEPAGVVIGVACPGLIFVGIPFAFYARSNYNRLVIEPGVGVRRYAVYRLTGPHLLTDLPWGEPWAMTAEPELRYVGEHRTPDYRLKLTADVNGESVLLGRLDGGREPAALDAPRRLLCQYLGARLTGEM